MVHGDVVDELHDDHGLAYTSSAEKADLAALVRLPQAQAGKVLQFMYVCTFIYMYICFRICIRV